MGDCPEFPFFWAYLDNKLGGLEKRIIKRMDESQEELARMVAEGFENVQRRLDVQQLIQAHERKFHKLEEALHIKLSLCTGIKIRNQRTGAPGSGQFGENGRPWANSCVMSVVSTLA